MALLPRTTPPGSNADAGVAVTFTAATASADDTITFGAGDVILAWNSGGSSRTVTIYSAPDPTGRIDDITAESIAAGAHRVYGPFKTIGWRQSDGTLKVRASHADVRFAILRRVAP